MSHPSDRTIAFALLEIRQLLSSYLGSEVDAPMPVRIAAHIAYALHNEADAVISGRQFDVEAAARKIGAIDRFLGVSDGTALMNRILPTP